MSRSGRVAVLAVPVAFGALIGGWFGMAMAVTSLLCVIDERPSVRRLVGQLAVALGVLMAVSTLVEGSLDQVGASFAVDRDLASLAGQLAAVLVVLLVSVAVIDERSVAKVQPLPGVQTGARHRVCTPSTMPGIVDAGTGVLVVAGALVRVFADPEALAPAYREVAANIERGAVYGVGEGLSVTESAVVAPAAPVIAALGPFGARFALVVTGLIAGVLVVRVARRIAGPAAGLIAAGATVVLPSWWGASLPALVAIVGVLAAGLLAEPARVDGRRAIGAGVSLAGAALARPVSLLAAVAVVVVLMLARRGSAALVVSVVAMVGFAPWYLWVIRNFDTLRPTAGPGGADADTVTALPWGGLGIAVDAAVVVAALALVVLDRMRRAPGGVRLPAALGRAAWPILVALGVVLLLVNGGDPGTRAFALPGAIVTLAVWAARLVPGAAVGEVSGAASAVQDEHAVPGRDLT